jgi:hypothetical protein
MLRLGLSIADLSDPRIEALRAAAADAHVELIVGGKGVKPQPLQVAELLQAKVAALLLVPSSPDLLHEIDRTVSAKSVALVAIGRGDGRVGAWVGLKSATLAKEAGEAAGRALLAAGCTKARFVLESSRWPGRRALRRRCRGSRPCGGGRGRDATHGSKVRRRRSGCSATDCRASSSRSMPWSPPIRGRPRRPGTRSRAPLRGTTRSWSA